MYYKSKEECCDCTVRCWITEKAEVGCGVPWDRFQSGDTNKTEKKGPSSYILVNSQDLSPGLCFSCDFSVVGLKEQPEAKWSVFDNGGVELYAVGFGALLWYGVGGVVVVFCFLSSLFWTFYLAILYHKNRRLRDWGVWIPVDVSWSC